MNLLAPQTKLEQRRFRQHHMVVTFVIALLTLMVLSAGVLIAAGSMVEKDRRDLQRQSEEELQKLDETAQRSVSAAIRDINLEAGVISQATSSLTVFSPILASIDQRTPSGITFQRLIVDGAKRRVSLTGHAKTREDVLTFIDGLRKLPILTDVQSPISNILQPEDVTFTVSATLVPPTL